MGKNYNSIYKILMRRIINNKSIKKRNKIANKTNKTNKNNKITLYQNWIYKIWICNFKIYLIIKK